ERAQRANGSHTQLDTASANFGLSWWLPPMCLYLLRGIDRSRHVVSRQALEARLRAVFPQSCALPPRQRERGTALPRRRGRLAIFRQHRFTGKTVNLSRNPMLISRGGRGLRFAE